MLLALNRILRCLPNDVLKAFGIGNGVSTQQAVFKVEVVGKCRIVLFTVDDICLIAGNQRTQAIEQNASLPRIEAKCRTTLCREWIELGQRRVANPRYTSVSQQTVGIAVGYLAVVQIDVGIAALYAIAVTVMDDAIDHL